MVGHYERSKFLAEQLALDFARRGLPVVVVNPTAPLGPWDVKPTPTGQMILDFMQGRMKATVETGLNVVHVRDVARGHLLAAERGKPGERYILGHQNLRLTELFEMLAELTGTPGAALAGALCGGVAGGGLLRGAGQRDAPATGGDADGGPHGTQAHVLQSRSGCARAGAAADGRTGGAG